MTYRSPPIGPGPAALRTPPPAPERPVPEQPAPSGFALPSWPARHPRELATVVGLVALGALTVVALTQVAGQIGTEALPGAAVLALLPLIAVVLAIGWVDRWEREPWPALAVAFGWGASVAVLGALWLNTRALLALVALGSPATAQVLGASVVGPVVEESLKALGLLLVFFAWRRSFDGPVDGLVYAATVAAGFAFVENILYFGDAMALSDHLHDGGASVVGVFVMRAGMSPFAHVLFTACTGLALGLASRSPSRGTWVWAFPLGLLVAIVLHGIWNGSALIGEGSSFLGLYALFQVPLFLGAIGLVFWLRRQEAAVVRTELLVYAAAGWFAGYEVEMLSSLSRRRRAAAWAEQTAGRGARREMRRFQAAATRLAYHRHRLRRRPTDAREVAEQERLLSELTAAREALQRSLPV